MSSSKAPRLATTVILITKYNDTYKILMMRRSSTAKFMPNVCVYPGGVIDNVDRDEFWTSRILEQQQNRLNSKEFDYASYMTGIREVFEETGVLLCTQRHNGNKLYPVTDEIRQLRSKIYKNPQEFLNMFQTYHDMIPLASLYPYAHWITPVSEKRRYDTKFYVALLPPSESFLPTPTPDKAGEAVTTEWLTCNDILRRYDVGDIQLSPPTVYTLLQMKPHDTYNDIVNEIQNNRRRIVAFMPRIVLKNNGSTVVSAFPGDPLNPIDNNNNNNEYMLHRMELELHRGKENRRWRLYKDVPGDPNEDIVDTISKL